MSVITLIVVYLSIGMIWYFYKVNQMKNHVGNPNPWEMKMEEERIKYSTLMPDKVDKINSEKFEKTIIAAESLVCAFMWPMGAVNEFTNGY